METAWKSFRKWFAGLGTIGLIVAAFLGFFGFMGILSGNVLPLMLGAAVFAGWWWWENRAAPVE